MVDRFTFTAPLWRWTARKEASDAGARCFVTLPPEVVDEVRERSGEPRGFGSVRVHVEAADMSWDTSVFPDSAADSFVLPVKKAVRAAAGIAEGDDLTVTLSLRDAGVKAPGLVATDLDGTLLHSDGTVTARSRAVLAELDALGIPVVFTTGRPVRWMVDLWEAVGGHGLAICSNGGIVYDVARREVRDFWPVPRDVGVSIAEQLRAEVPGTTFAIEHTTGWASEGDFPSHPDDRAEHVRGDYAEMFGDDVVKILAVHRELDPEAFWQQVEAVVGDQVVTTWSSSFALVEISAPGITKATTLATVAAEMGLGPEDVVAFGDMPNDLSMLAWAGTSYAMANAHPSVLDLADHRAPSNDDDGVAAVLTDLFSLAR